MRRRARRARWYWRVLRTLLIGFVLFTASFNVAARWPQRLPRYAADLEPGLVFERVAEPGFDQAGRQRLNDSAWSMRYFQADGEAVGYLYVGTDNNIVGLTLSAVRSLRTAEDLPVIPPEIRRYRPDLGPLAWEVVLDLAEHEEPPYLDQGFRTMALYTSQADGRTYLYAGTMASHSPTVWRTASGDPGTWEKVFTFPNEPEGSIGSVRGMVAHDDGLLYMSTTPVGDIVTEALGQIWATDGLTFTQVITDGFGDRGNAAVTMLSSFEGCLYAGTYNPVGGYQVWQLRCVEAPDAPPRAVIRGGAGFTFNEAVMSMRPFNGHLYIGTGIPLGFNPVTRRGPRGCHVVRLDGAGNWEVIVGRRVADPTSGYGPGFGWYLNAYCWYMQEHDGHLYLGTWDLSRTIAFVGQQRRRLPLPLRPLLRELVLSPDRWGSPMGGDLYRTADGTTWEPVFLDGLGNPDNHGIRTLESTPLGFFVGTENPFTRLEVWRLVEEVDPWEQLLELGGQLLEDTQD